MKLVMAYAVCRNAVIFTVIYKTKLAQLRKLFMVYAVWRNFLRSSITRNLKLNMSGINIFIVYMYKKKNISRIGLI